MATPHMVAPRGCPVLGAMPPGTLGPIKGYIDEFRVLDGKVVTDTSPPLMGF